MASTPSHPSTTQENADFTRQPEPESPTNLNPRTSKRHRRDLNVNPPPRLELGGGAHNNMAAATIRNQLDAIERDAKLQRTIMYDFANNVDKFVSSYERPELRNAAYKLSERVVGFLTTYLYAETNGATYAPIRIKSHPSREASSSGPSKSVSFAEVAGMANSLRNPGVNLRINRDSNSFKSGSTPTSSTGGVTLISGDSKPEDKRLLIAVKTEVLLNRPEPFAIRQELCAKIDGLTLKMIPTISPTRTGWSITPMDLSVRNLLTTQENIETLRRVTQATSITRPQEWFNYAVPGVPATMHRLMGGAVTNTAELIAEEVTAQTQATPVSCRPSRHGTNADTGKTTWIVSFLIPVRPFRLFNISEISKFINKKPAIKRHDPGCQGFCNPAKCTKYSRCSHCGTRNDLHQGPSGANCTGIPRCANCHGPFPAGHDHCPAAPSRKNGIIIKLTKRELNAIRRQGNRDYRDANIPPPPNPAAQLQSQVRGPQTNVTPAGTTRKRPASRVQDYEDMGSTPILPPPRKTPIPPPSPRPRLSTAARPATVLIDDEEDELNLDPEGDNDMEIASSEC